MKKLTISLFALLLPLAMMAQGWPSKFGGVMLQGFYWDSYSDTQWTLLESQADDLSQSFDLIWIPQSANCGGTSMGYDDLYWFPGHYNSSFGTEAELRSMIATFKAKGLKTIADVVINHRKNVSSWVDFPRETYNGQVYELKSTDIVSDDDGGKCLTWAKANGYSLGNPEQASEVYSGSCEGWDGMRDLDHTSANVQTNVKAYLNMLLNDLGYSGFRYDMVKGYPGKYTGIYNDYSKPEFSVGEFWDGNAANCQKWLDATKVNGAIQSAVFDFPFRYTVRDAVNNSNWSRLSTAAVASNEAYRRYAVTFVENHDTEWRSSDYQLDPLKKDTLAANAWLLAMPGTPCVFLKHWQAYPAEIRSMIALRRKAGITNESSFTSVRSSTRFNARSVDGKLLVVVGDESMMEPDAAEWTRALSGYHFAYYLSNSLETAWASLASGNYTGEQKVLLSAASKSSGVQLVYTTDGSAPTASSTRVASGTTITIPVGTTVLRVALLAGSTVKGEVGRNYVVNEPPTETDANSIPSFCTIDDGELCAFFESPDGWGGVIKCWAWTNSPADNFTGGQWPGADCKLLGVAQSGRKVWKWTWDGTKQNNTSAAKPDGIIFSNGGNPQTGDLSFENGGYYTFEKGLIGKGTTAGIGAIAADADGSRAVYTVGGQRVSKAVRPGIYISGGKKIIVR